MPLPRVSPVCVPALIFLLVQATAPGAPAAETALPGSAALALAREAEIHVRHGRPREAEGPARRALAVARSARDTTAMLRALRWLAVSVGQQGRGAEMAALWRRALLVATARGDLATGGFAHLGIGHHALSGGRTGEAFAEFRTARELFMRAGDAEWAAWALLGMGQASTDPSRARECFRRVVAGADPARSPGLVASASNNLAVLEFGLGDPAAAAAAFRAAYATERDPALLGDRITEGANVAICEAEMGRYDAAAALLDTLLRLSRERGFRGHEAKVLLEQGDLLRRRGRLGESARCLREALDLSAAGLLKNHVESAAGLARTLADADSLAAAERIVADFARRAAAWRPFPYQAELDLLDGELRLRAGRAGEALALFARAERAAGARGLGRERVSALVGLGRAWRAAGGRDSALAALARAESLWERARGVMSDPEWREVYGAQARALHGTLAALALDPGGAGTAAERAARVFGILQRYKARTLHERMLGPDATRGGPGRPAPAPEPVSARELQRDVLRPGECYIELFSGADTTLLVALTRDRLLVAGLPADLPARMARWRRAIATPPNPRGRPAARAALALSAGAFHDELFAPCSTMLRTSTRVIVCPDGALNLVPFPLLFASRSGAGRGGRAEVSVAQVPSASILARLRAVSPPAAPRAIAVFADAPAAGTRDARLPGAAREARWLAARFAHVDLRGGAAGDGSPAAVPIDWPRYGLLHFATHAVADDQHPWRSGVRVGAAEGGDPYLRAASIASAPLAARLAVIAGCESAGGRVLSGEGVQGLAAAFLSAGVPAVVASLWPVDDRATERLVEEFYLRLARGQPAAAALARAQAAVGARPHTADPFYWAGFVVVGDPGVTAELTRRAGWMGPALAAAAILAALWALARRARRPGGPRQDSP